MRVAPKIGYDNDVKHAYREQVWNAFSKAVDDMRADQTGTMKAVIMPSSEGIEIEVALSKGLREDQIVCVDRSAAVIATSKWRKKYPGVNFFACDVGKVGHKIKHRKWVVRAANLDLCGNFSDDTIDAVQGFIRFTPIHESFAIGVTVAKGREGSALTRLIKTRNAGDRVVSDDRLQTLFDIIPEFQSYKKQLASENVYRSASTPMTWCVLDCEHVNVQRRRDEAARLAKQAEIDRTIANGFRPFFECFGLRDDDSDLTDSILLNRDAFIAADPIIEKLSATNLGRDLYHHICSRFHNTGRLHWFHSNVMWADGPHTDRIVIGKIIDFLKWSGWSDFDCNDGSRLKLTDLWFDANRTTLAYWAAAKLDDRIAHLPFDKKFVKMGRVRNERDKVFEKTYARNRQLITWLECMLSGEKRMLTFEPCEPR